MDTSKKIIKILRNKKVDFFTGVPDSVLKNFCNALSKLSNKKHIISSNEGGAVSLATGYNLATKKIPLVYLQNSGLGNTINPITSILLFKQLLTTICPGSDIDGVPASEINETIFPSLIV